MQLSILIPSRNEMFLAKTIEDIIQHAEAETEIIVVLDGQWADPLVPQHPMVNIIYVPESIGQRAGQNLACKLAKGKWVMKVDAHCSFDQGFDRKMVEFMEQHPEDTAVPVMRNLWAFDWKCYHCGWKKYQGPTPSECPQCGKKDKIRRKMIWTGKENPQSTSYCFDSEPHFQYFQEFKNREEYKEGKKKGYTETMSLQGSCFMCSRKNYWKYEMCDEQAGSWGNQGIELALATWLCGRRVLVNHNTWYSHMFRTQGGDFSFPYEQKGRQVQKTKNYIKDKFWQQKHPLQIHPVSWLIEKFMPVPGWDEEKIKQLRINEQQWQMQK